MAGHGSPPPDDRARHPGRQVGRTFSTRASDLAQIGRGSTSPAVNAMAARMMSQPTRRRYRPDERLDSPMNYL